MARGRMPSHSSPSVSTPAMTMNRLDWVKFTEAPSGPSAVCSWNWLSASMLDPCAATVVVSPARPAAAPSS